MSASAHRFRLRYGRAPAYARELECIRRAGQRPADYVVVTDSWDLARFFRDEVDRVALVCDPPDRAYDFAVLHDLDVMAVHLWTVPPPWVAQIRAHSPRSLEVWEARAFCRHFAQPTDAA